MPLLRKAQAQQHLVHLKVPCFEAQIASKWHMTARAMIQNSAFQDKRLEDFFLVGSAAAVYLADHGPQFMVALMHSNNKMQVAWHFLKGLFLALGQG